MSVPSSHYTDPPQYTPQDPQEFDEKMHPSNSSEEKNVQLIPTEPPPYQGIVSNALILQNPIPNVPLKIRKIQASKQDDNIVWWLARQLYEEKNINIRKPNDRNKISDLNIISKLYKWDNSLCKDVWFEVVLLNPKRQSFIPKEWNGLITHKRVDVFAEGVDDKAFKNDHFLETCTKAFFAFVRACFVSNDVNAAAVTPHLETIMNRGFTIEYAFLENEKKKIAYNCLSHAAVRIGKEKILLQIGNPDPIYESSGTICIIS